MRANLVMFDWVRIKLDGVESGVNFSRPPQGKATAYYTTIERTF